MVQLGEWMPSSASGGNDQSFISFLQCHSPQPSILEACNSGFFSSRWPQEQESWGEVGRPLQPSASRCDGSCSLCFPGSLGGPSWSVSGLLAACRAPGAGAGGGHGWQPGVSRAACPAAAESPWSRVPSPYPTPPGDTTFRTQVISPRSRPGTPCPFAGVFPHWEVQSTL